MLLFFYLLLHLVSGLKIYTIVLYVLLTVEYTILAKYLTSLYCRLLYFMCTKWVDSISHVLISTFCKFIGHVSLYIENPT